jgi:hypothetical protein
MLRAALVLVVLALLGVGHAGISDIWPGANDIRAGGNLDFYGTTRGGTALRTAVTSSVNMPTPLSRAEVVRMTTGANIRRAATAVLANGRRYSTWWTLGAVAVVQATNAYIQWAERQTPLPASLQAGGAVVQPVFTLPGTYRRVYFRVHPDNETAVEQSVNEATPGVVRRWSVTHQLEHVGNGQCAIRLAVWNVQTAGELIWSSGWGDSGATVWEPYGTCPATDGFNNASVEYSTQYHADAAPAAIAHFAQFIATHLDLSYQSGMTVEQALETDPAAQDFARLHAIPWWLDNPASAAALPQVQPNPNTWAQPWTNNQYVTFNVGERPTWHVWAEACYAVTIGVDTDGDGWSDWFECRMGTDPFNPQSYPGRTADPDKDGHTNEQEHAAMTDPLDPNDKPGENDVPALTPDADPDAPLVREDMQDVLAAIRELEAQLRDVAREGRQVEQLTQGQAQLEALYAQLAMLEAMLEVLEGGGSDPSGEVVAELELEPVGLMPATSARLELMATNIGASLEDARAALASRAPFHALSSGWVPTPSLMNAEAPCPGASMTILGSAQEVGICDTPVHAFLAGTGRLVFLALALIAFYLATARTVAWS